MKRRLSPTVKVSMLAAGLLLVAIILLLLIASWQVQQISKRAVATYQTQSNTFVAERLRSETDLIAQKITADFITLAEWPIFLANHAVDAQLAPSREHIALHAEHVLGAAAGFNSVYLHFEPNTMGVDQAYENADWSSNAGTLEIYWLRENGDIRFEPTPDTSVKYNTALDTHQQPVSYWYLCPRDTRALCLSQPYTWALLNGEQIELMSLTYPIMRAGEFIGVSGGDINIDMLAQRFDEYIALLFSGRVESALYTGAGRLIVGSAEPPGFRAAADTETNGVHRVTQPVRLINQDWYLVAELSMALTDDAIAELNSVVSTSSQRFTSTITAVAAGLFMIVAGFAVRYIHDREHRIAASKQALEQANQDLQQKVEQKTARLQSMVTDLKNAQNELIETGKIAALGRLVAGVAHELNTPLGNALMSASQQQSDLHQLRSDLANGLRKEQLERFLSNSDNSVDITLRNVERAAELVRSFKEISVDQQSMRYKTFELKELFNDIQLVLQPSMRSHQVNLVMDCAPFIECEGYPGALEQVLINLIQNAFVHAFIQRAADKQVMVNFVASDDVIEIKVSDNGQGIPDTQLPHIFEPFFTTKLGHGGSGLGLSIVHNLVTRQLKGRIKVTSELGVGTTFYIVIPRKVAIHPTGG